MELKEAIEALRKYKKTNIDAIDTILYNLEILENENDKLTSMLEEIWEENECLKDLLNKKGGEKHEIN